MNNSKTFALFVLIMCAGAALMFGVLTKGHIWGDDFAGYIMQARSLADGTLRQFVAENRFTIEQSTYPIGPVVSPWGCSLLLAPLYAVFGLNLFAFKMVGMLSFLLFLILLRSGFRRVHAPAWLLCLVGLFALNPTMLSLTNDIMSDLPFLLVSTLAIVLIRETVMEGRRVISPIWDSALIGAVIAAAHLLRPNGPLLLVTLGFAHFIARERIRAAPRFVTALPYLVFFGAILACRMTLPPVEIAPSWYVAGISAATIKRNLLFYFEVPSKFLFGVPYREPLYWASVPLAVIGAIRRRRTDGHTIVYVALTLLLYIVFPFRQGLRYAIPILPFYASFAISGLETLQARVSQKRFWELACLAPVLVVIIFLARQSVIDVGENLGRNRERTSGPYTAASHSLFNFISEHTKADRTIIFFKPRALKLITNRNSIMIKRPDQLSRGDYLCMYLGKGAYNQVEADDVDARVADGTARLVYKNSDFELYALNNGRAD